MQPFRFLDLPRELRNIIYEHAIVNVHLQSDAFTDESQCFLQNVLQTNILLASRQMNHEYREQLADRTYLLVTGAHYDYWMDFCCPSKPVCDVIKRSVIYAHVVCFCDFMTEDESNDFLGPCDAADALYSYLEDLRVDSILTQMPQLQSCRLKIGLWCARDAPYEKADENSQEPPKLTHTSEFKVHLTDLTTLPHMESIEIGRCANDGDYAQYCIGKALPTIAEWSLRDGWCSQWK